MKRIVCSIRTVAVFASCLLAVGESIHAQSVAGPLIVHVSVDGSDTNAGTESAPVATLSAARDVVRKAAARGGLPAGAQVLLGPGRYVSSDTVELNASDSGADFTPTVYRAAVPGTVELVGGRPVSLDSFTAVTDPKVVECLDESARSHVRKLDLAVLGVKPVTPFPDKFDDHGGVLRLFMDGKRLPISRWPADGYATMNGVVDSGIVPTPHGGTFHFSGDRPARWTTALAERGVWLVGFWRVPWVVTGVRVDAIDTVEKTITLKPAITMGIGSKYAPTVDGTRAGDRSEPWYAMNLIEEITGPGQWAVDFQRQTLYLWPPETGTEVLLAERKTPIVHVNGAVNLRFEGITFEATLGEAVRVSDSRNVTLIGCTIQNTCGAGIVVKNSTLTTIDSCDIQDVGAEGVVLGGGDRRTLTSSSNQLVNNHIHHTGRVAAGTYAVSIEGVGATAAHNLVHDAPLGGFNYTGNDHTFEYNEVHNIGLDGGDLGAFYTNGDWASRGHVIRHNFVHHAPNANAVYVDDGNSGVTIERNLVYKSRSAVFIGGGHDNVAHANVAVMCDIGLHLDDRGKARGYTIDRNGALTRTLKTLDLSAAPWSTRYPALLEMLSKPADLPRPTGNDISGNVLIDCKKPIDFPRDDAAKVDNRLSPNDEHTGSDGFFADVSKLNFTSTSSAGLDELDLKIGSIGLVKNAYRPTLPTDAETGRNESRPPRRLFKSEVDVEQTNKDAKH